MIVGRPRCVAACGPPITIRAAVRSMISDTVAAGSSGSTGTATRPLSQHAHNTTYASGQLGAWITMRSPAWVSAHSQATTASTSSRTISTVNAVPSSVSITGRSPYSAAKRSHRAANEVSSSGSTASVRKCSCRRALARPTSAGHSTSRCTSGCASAVSVCTSVCSSPAISRKVCACIA